MLRATQHDLEESIWTSLAYSNKWKNQEKYNLNSLELEVLHLKIELKLEGICKGYSNEEYRELLRKAKPFLEANE